MKSKMQRVGLWLVPVLLVGLALCSSVLALTPPIPESEISFDGGVPLAPNVTPVIIVRGSDYEMGYQWYQQLVQIYGPWIMQGKVPGEEEYKRLRLRFRYQGYDFSEEELKALKAYQRVVRQSAPEMIDIWKGMADGATDAGIPLTYTQVMAQWFGGPRYWKRCSSGGVPPESESEVLPPEENCSGFAAWGSATKDGRLVCGVTPDQETEFDVVIVAFPEEGGNSFIVSPFNALGDGGKITSTPKLGGAGMNSKGLSYLFASDVSSKTHAEWYYGLTAGICSLHTLRFANDAEEALDMLLDLPNGDDHAGGMWADIHGNAFYVESRENPRIVRRPGHLGEVDFLYATNNALHREAGGGEGGGTLYIRHAGWGGVRNGKLSGGSSLSRNLQLWNMLQYYHGHVDREFVKMMYRFAGDPNPGSPILEPELGEVDASSYEVLGNVNLEKRIGGLHNDRVIVMVPDDGEFYVCQGRAGRVAYPPVDRAPYLIDSLYSFYQLKLESDPAEITEVAVERAQYELIRASQELMKLNYSDPAYAPLTKIFDRAATEFRKGTYYHDVAENTTGNESIYNWSRALRGFTRCQAYAQHVYESLVPPAATPEDLGLEPWGYWVQSFK